MNRRWLLSAVLLMVGFALVDWLASDLTLQKFRANPPILSDGEQEFTVYHPELFPETNYLQSVTHASHHLRYFGVVHRFQTHSGEVFACDQVVYWYWCDGNWQATAQ